MGSYSCSKRAKNQEVEYNPSLCTIPLMLDGRKFHLITSVTWVLARVASSCAAALAERRT